MVAQEPALAHRSGSQFTLGCDPRGRSGRHGPGDPQTPAAAMPGSTRAGARDVDWTSPQSGAEESGYAAFRRLQLHGRRPRGDLPADAGPALPMTPAPGSGPRSPDPGHPRHAGTGCCS